MTDNKLFLNTMLDKARKCIDSGEAVFTGFINPIDAEFAAKEIKKKFDLNTACGGGYEEAERVVLKIFDGEMGENDYFPIDVIEIKKSKASSGKELTHRDYLGSILGLSINRDKIGDIIIKDFGAYVYVKAEISEFLLSTLRKVKRTEVEVSKLKQENIFDAFAKAPQIIKKSLSSLRLDNVLSAGFNLSRAESLELVKKEKAFVNYRMESGGSKQVSQGDIISLRGQGRLKIIEIQGKTKKDKIIVLFEKY